MRLDRVGAFRTAFEKNRKVILATQQICGICGQPVDKTIKYPHPLSPTVDHIIPVDKGGHPSDLSNLQLAHRWCNRQKSNKLFDSAKDRRDLERQGEINNDILPLHCDWKKYKAN